MEVARWKGYDNEEQLLQQPRDVQARAIAHYRVHHQIQAVLMKEQQQEQKKASQRARASRQGKRKR